MGGSGPAGFTTEPLSQFDFTAPGIEAFYGALLGEAVDGGHDGWMEDFGEGVPPRAWPRTARPAQPCTTATRPITTARCSGSWRRSSRTPCAICARAGRARPAARWTSGAAIRRPTWGFDGLESGVRQALGIGMSGVSRFGTDIGGYNTYGTEERLTPELLIRWIQFGAVSGVMRTKRSGLAFPSYERPQVFDPEILPHWRRYTKLHTQLYPYILAADARYRRTGLPLMRHLALAWPRDEAAVAADGEFMFGPDLLAAPVVEPGAKNARALPAGAAAGSTGGGAFGTARRTARSTPAVRRVLRGGAERTAAGAAGGAAAAGPRRQRAAAASRRRGHARALRPRPRAPRDRRGRLSLLAFPRGRWRGRMFEGERLRSMETRRGWRLRVGVSARGATRSRPRWNAAAPSSRRGYARRPAVAAPGMVVLGRREVLRVRFSARRATLVVRAAGRSAPGA